MSDWYLKLIVLSASASLVGLIILTDFNKNKRFVAYFLIALFAQTGFAYAIKPGYHTSAAELIYFASLIFFLDAFDLICSIS